jgi:outer membrane protein TolC
VIPTPKFIGHPIRNIAACGILAALVALPASAQQTSPPQAPPATPVSTTPITLAEALTRATANEPTFAAAVAASRNAGLDRSIARASLLPNAVLHNQFIYTEPLHGPAVSSNPSTSNPAITGNPRFIASNSIHEYVNQVSVTETIGAQQFNAVTRATTSLAIATAELEIARRGLNATVVGLYYASLAADRKLAVAQRAATEATSFSILTQQRETAREAAHADVVKAQLQVQQRDRDVADARLGADKARLDLAVLLFPDPRSPYTLAVSDTPEPPSRSDVEAALARSNPELQSALATSRLADLSVTSARLAYLPALSLNYSYGIDAPEFATNGPDGSRFLGYSAFATLDIPIWDWFTTQNKIRQSRINRDVAHTVLTNTQRTIIAQLEEFYAEATVAHDQLKSLDDSVATATESLRLTRLRYTSGEATVFEVVDAQTSLVTTELAREDGVTRYQTALANLKLLTGTI